jgi:hypothetical protein
MVLSNDREGTNQVKSTRDMSKAEHAAVVFGFIVTPSICSSAP